MCVCRWEGGRGEGGLDGNSPQKTLEPPIGGCIDEYMPCTVIEHKWYFLQSGQYRTWFKQVVSREGMLCSTLLGNILY